MMEWCDKRKLKFGVEKHKSAYDRSFGFNICIERHDISYDTGIKKFYEKYLLICYGKRQISIGWFLGSDE